MQLPLTLQLKPSRIYLIVLASGHTLAGVAVCLLGWPWLICTALVLLLVLLLQRSWRQVLNGPSAVLLRADGKLDLLMPDASSALVEVATDSLVLPWLVIVHLHGESKLPPLVIWPDALAGADDHRQLRLWLKWCEALPEKA